MFAGLLNKGFRGSLVLLITVFLVSFVINYLSPLGLEEDHYPNLFYNYFAEKIGSKLAINALNFIFIGFGVLLVSLISVNQEIVDKQNYFPVFLYMLVCIAGVSPTQITSQIFTNVFVLFAIYKLLDTYRVDNPLKQIFDAAFWLSVSAFITISSIISFPLFFVILLILRPFNWREWMIALVGFIIPVFIYESMAYLSNFNQWYLFDATRLYFRFMKSPSFSEYYLPLFISLVFLLIISFLYSMVTGFGNTVKKQRTKSILIWFIFFSTFGFFSGGANSSNIILIYSLPLSFFIGDFLFNLKQLKITNTILAILIFCVVVVFLGQFQLI
ncbi:DUF6427 family protein [Aurantibacillus circumpalustris]|uniref:DUF6427 family protein n=1 Tax=Aurantibacillus circumpalustris TaxID=3036359 RepID=UPI00295B20B1|nr:DUF6427 family protein [Aurantibacillus circumpalustris]